MNSKIKRWVLLAIAPVALLAIAACGSDDAPTSVGDAAASLVASSDNAEQTELGPTVEVSDTVF